MSIFSDIINFIFPASCPKCHEAVHKKGEWCPKCLSETIAIKQIHKSDEDINKLFSGGSYRLASYRSTAGELIRALKYNKKMDCLKNIHVLIRNAFKNKKLQKKIQHCQLAIAVPLHEKKLKQRGFNQVAEMFREPLEEMGLLWSDSLKRVIETRPQFNLKADERKVNMKKAFAVEKKADIVGKDILLVDDIMTTGSTLKWCAYSLLEAGANSVTALVLTSDDDK